MPEEVFDWTYFRKKTYVRASREKLFQAWAVPEEIVKWFIAEASYKTPEGNTRKNDEVVQGGDMYEWTFYQGLTLKGEVLKVVPGEMFRFTFGDKFPESDEKVIVTVTFHEDGRDTWLILEQTNIAEDERGKVTFNLSCNLGWTFFITNLKSVFESGYDLREKERQKAIETRAITL